MTRTRSWVTGVAVAALVLGLAPAGAASATAAAPGGWSVQASPNPPKAAHSELNAVACHGPATCVAVGFSYVHTAGHTLPLAEGWNGTTWAIQHVPALPTAGRTFLTGVSCPAVRECVAVGVFAAKTAGLTLVERYSG